MTNRKITRQYHFTVDGETELWYLEWLEKTINNNADIKNKVSLKRKIKNPIKYAKGLATISKKTEVVHFFDYESHEQIHTEKFIENLDNMKAASGLGKGIEYKSGYSNFTFELWILLHMTDSFGGLTHRSQYLKPINRAYGENFENLDQFKHEGNFKRVLGNLSLQNVRDAIARAKAIQNRNKENDYKLHEYKGYTYYKENPSLAIWESIEKILVECGLSCINKTNP